MNRLFDIAAAISRRLRLACLAFLAVFAVKTLAVAVVPLADGTGEAVQARAHETVIVRSE